MKTKKKKTIEPIVRYNPEAKIGLSTEQVIDRKSKKLTNAVNKQHTKTYLQIFAENTFTFFNLIWLVILVALLWVRAYADTLFIVVVVANTAIAIFQEIRAKITVQRLSLITTPKVKVVRDGEERMIDTEQIVLDDIVVFSAGGQVSADCEIRDGDVEVNESLLTGESKPVKKSVGAMIFAGSFVVSGKCVAQAIKIGTDVYIESIAREAKKVQKPNSALFKDLNKLIKIIGIVLIPMAVFMFLNNYIGTPNTLATAVQKTSGSVTGLIPAGMFLLTTMALAVGVVKLGRKKTLVQDIYSIEMLARTNVLCLDKTGTITDGTMAVKDVKILCDKTKEDIGTIIANISASQPNDNQTGRALISYFGKDSSFELVKNVAFSSNRKQTITEFKDEGTYVLGAPEFIDSVLSDETKKEIKAYADDGYRVLLLARSKKHITKEDSAEDCQALALVVIEDHIREDAPETIAWFKQNGVAIKIISGDNPATVSAIAKRVGVENAENYVSLESLSLEEVEKIANDFTVFGRVSPEQKLMIVKALKKKGLVVAMTGDGVNDTLALKESDCSIAMADGSEVARGISNLVLMDSKFSSLPKVVEEGRQVINNVQNASSLFLMKTLFTLILSVITIVTFTEYPFSPKMAFMLELFVIGIPSFFLALEPNKNIIKGHFLSTVLKRSLPYGLILFVNIAIILVFGRAEMLTSTEVSTLATLTLATTGFLCLVKMCVPFTKIRAICVAISSGLIVLATSIMPKFFGMTNFSPIVLKIYGLLASVTLLGLTLWIFINNYIAKKNKT